MIRHVTTGHLARAALLTMALFIGTGCAAGATSNPAAVQAPTAAEGETLVRSHNCVRCHSLLSTTKPGPTWRGVGTRRTAAELEQSIRSPQAVIVEGFDVVEMPTFDLTDHEVDSIVAYLATLR